MFCYDNKTLEATSFLDKKFMQPYSLRGSSSRLGIYIDLASVKAVDGSGGKNVEGGTHGKPRSREECGDPNCSFPSNPCTELDKPHESKDIQSPKDSTPTCSKIYHLPIASPGDQAFNTSVLENQSK